MRQLVEFRIRPPFLWIIIFNGILTLQLPKEGTVIGFVTNIGVTIIRKGIKANENLTNEAFRGIRSWHGFARKARK